MHKILPILLSSLLLAACSGGSNDNGAASVPAAAATSPVASGSAATTADAGPAAASTGAEPSHGASAPAAASTSQPATAATSDSSATAPVEAGKAAEVADSKQTPPAEASPDSSKWVEGENYFVLQPQQPRLSTSSKVQVVEVFSYGCPACFHSQPFMMKLAKSLPAYAEMDYLPVSFRPDENFPLYQRAFYTAQALGVARKAHDAMFDAVWKSGEIGTYNLASGRPKPHDEWPDMADIAKFYAGYGVDPKQFEATASSFAINTKMKRADQLIKNWQVNSTPTIVIDGKYRYTANSAGGYDQMLEMTQWLVAREHRAMQAGQ